MTAIALIDEDWSKADPLQLAAAGYRGVIGYVSQDTTGKNLSRVQVDAIHAAGLDVGLVYEYDPQSALGGASAGTRDAQIATSHAQALGAPAGIALGFAVDFQVTVTQLPVVLAYALAFRAAAAAAGYRATAYCDYLVCQYLDAHGWAQLGLLWQTYAWSAGAWWPRAVLRQTANGITVAGATVDRDEAEGSDWGQWPPMTGDALMTDPLTPTDQAELLNSDRWGYATAFMLDQVQVDANDNPATPATYAVPLTAFLKALDGKVSALQTGGVDLDALAGKVAPLVIAVLGPKLDKVLSALAAAGREAAS